MIDEIDLKIIFALMENSRLSFSELAKSLGISRPTIKKRVEELVKNGVIEKFTVKISEKVLKRSYSAFAIVETDKPEEIVKLKCVNEVYKLCGNKYLVSMKFCSMDGIRETFTKLTEFSDSVEFYPCLTKIKEDNGLQLNVEIECEVCGKKTDDFSFVDGKIVCSLCKE